MVESQQYLPKSCSIIHCNMASKSNFVRGALKRNPNHKRDGLRSYVHAMNKWGFGPTIRGPYCRVNQVHQQGQQAVFKQTGKRV